MSPDDVVALLQAKVCMKCRNGEPQHPGCRRAIEAAETVKRMEQECKRLWLWQDVRPPLVA